MCIVDRRVPRYHSGKCARASKAICYMNVVHLKCYRFWDIKKYPDRFSLNRDRYITYSTYDEYIFNLFTTHIHGNSNVL